MSDSSEEGHDYPPVTLPVRLFCTLLPIGLTIAIFALVWISHGLATVEKLFALMAATFLGLGKFAVFADVIVQALGDYARPWFGMSAEELFADLTGVVGLRPGDAGVPYVLAGLVTYMDLCSSLVVCYNLDVLFRTPWLGDKLRAMQRASGEIMLAFPSLARASFIGTILFVGFPVTGTGAVGGALLGQLLGFSRLRTITAIAIGAVLGTFGMAAGAHLLGDQLQVLLKNPAIGITVLAVFVIAFISLNLFVRSKVAALREARANDPDAESIAEAVHDAAEGEDEDDDNDKKELEGS